MPSAKTDRPRALRVGLTGGFGTGKSTVLAMLKKKGAKTVDADAIVHGLFEKDAALRAAVRKRFGAEAMDGKGGINRPALARKIFSKPAERRALERIVHPAVYRGIDAVLKNARTGVVVADVPLLYESGGSGRFDVVVVVSASRATRIRRLATRGFSARDFHRRARAQWPLEKKERRADIVVDNNGTKARTQKQIDMIWQQLANHARVVRGKNGRKRA